MNSRCHVDAVDRVMAALSQGNHSLTKYWRINKEINFLAKQKVLTPYRVTGAFTMTSSLKV